MLFTNNRLFQHKKDWTCRCSLVSCSRSRPPHRTGQAHLQHLSTQVDCYKAAGWEQTGQWAEPPDSVVMLSVVNQSCVLLFMFSLLPQGSGCSVICSYWLDQWFVCFKCFFTSLPSGSCFVLTLQIFLFPFFLETPGIINII